MSSGVRGLHHAQLAMPPGGEHVAREFWAGLLGMTELVKPQELAARGGCWFRSGRLEVHLGVAEPFTPAAKAHAARPVVRRERDSVASSRASPDETACGSQP